MIALFLFYEISAGKQARLAFSREFRHCNIITYDGSNWITVEFDATGIVTRVLEVTSGKALVRGLKSIKVLTAMIAVDIEVRKRVSWKPFWVRSCNELGRYVSGVNVGFTFNPKHLYSKLLRFNRKRNYEVITHWRRKDGLFQ